MKKYLLLISVLLLFSLVGCGDNNSSKEATSLDTTLPDTNGSYLTISAKEAKAYLDANPSIIIVDVRTFEEFETGYIKDALLIPHTELEKNAEKLLPDKTKTIFIYCRSGRRSAFSAKILSDLGYESVFDFGGIIDWPYDIEKIE